MRQRFDVQGMTCDHCARAVTDAVRRVDAHARIDVDLASGRVEVESGEPRERIAAAIHDEGYAVSG
ncbi:MAG TPA: heavy-metal-associated domain-containing protein [Burkholderiaceae bacterium]|nr:heavy-metal-associated domain-containing protein [Burkholderiaceae bacterium]